MGGPGSGRRGGSSRKKIRTLSRLKSRRTKWDKGQKAFESLLNKGRRSIGLNNWHHP